MGSREPTRRPGVGITDINPHSCSHTQQGSLRRVLSLYTHREAYREVYTTLYTPREAYREVYLLYTHPGRHIGRYNLLYTPREAYRVVCTLLYTPREAYRVVYTVLYPPREAYREVYPGLYLRVCIGWYTRVYTSGCVLPGVDRAASRCEAGPETGL